MAPIRTGAREASVTNQDRFCRHVFAGIKGKLAAQGFAGHLCAVCSAVLGGLESCEQMTCEHKQLNEARNQTVREVIFREESVFRTIDEHDESQVSRAIFNFKNAEACLRTW